MNDIHTMKWRDIKDVRRQIEYLHAKRDEWTYPIEIMIEGFPMGTRCWSSEQLVWFRNGFEMAMELADLQQTRRTTKK